jgi:RNA polymerase sigma-70 factor (ECF subfamily)
VYTIARNTLIDFFRTNKIHDELGEEDIVEEDAFQGIFNEETLDELAEALKKLPEREREIILLHYYYNKQLKEIALKLHMSYSNCKLVHNKALMKLRQYLS